METHVVSPLIWLVATQLALYAGGWAICSVMVPEERAATLNWCAFAVLVGLGLLLAGSRTDARGWWAYCGSNVFTVCSYVALLRGGALFVRAPARDIEHAITVAITIGVLTGLGAGAGNAAWRVLFVYAMSTAIIVRALMRLWRPIGDEFGPRMLLVVVPSGLLIAVLFAARTVQQALHMGVPLEIHSETAGNAPILVGYLAGAALFNFGFLSLLIMRLVERLRNLSQRDPLTGLLNRRALDAELQREWGRFRRDGAPFAMLAVDIDHFKGVNDEHGHAGGDAVLAAMALQLRASARQSDVVARTGGEEFVLLMTGVTARGGLEAAQRLRRAVEAAAVEHAGRRIQVTVSVGLAVPSSGDADAGAVMQRADRLLYAAKAAGRNCVRADEAEVEAPSTAAV